MKYLQIIFPMVLLAVFWVFGLSLLLILYPHSFHLNVWDFLPLLAMCLLIFVVNLTHHR